MKPLFFALLIAYLISADNASAFDLGELATDVLPPSISGVKEETPTSPLLGQNAPVIQPRVDSGNDIFGNIEAGQNKEDENKDGFLGGLKDFIGLDDKFSGTSPKTDAQDSGVAKIENKRTGRTPIVPKESTAIVDSVVSPQSVREKPSGIATRRTVDSALDSTRILGLRLKYSPHEVASVMERQGFSLLDTNKSIQTNLDIELRLACRDSGMHEISRQRLCTDEQIAITKMVFGRSDRRLRNRINLLNASEIMTVEFTNSYGGNVAYKITYRTRGDASLGFTSDGKYQRESWHKAFYARLTNRFGQPSHDYGNRWVWGDENGENTSIQAFFANTDLDAMVIISNNYLQNIAESKAITRAAQLEDRRTRRKFRF